MASAARHITQFVAASAASWRTYALALLPAAALYALLYLQPWLPMASLIRDPVAILDGSFYHGLVSNIGVLLWCATAAICLFRGAELARQGWPPGTGFLLAAGAVTLVLLLDDFFLAHEQIIPRFTGIPEKAVLASYVVVVAGYVWANWRAIVRADAALLLLGLGFFALSNAIDVVFGYYFYDTPVGQEVSPSVIFEEATKFIGIAIWATFHIRAAWLAADAAWAPPRVVLPPEPAEAAFEPGADPAAR